MKKANDTACESVEGNAFDIEDIIDVDNLDLRNTLSDKPISNPKLLLKEKQQPCEELPTRFLMEQ